MCMYVWNMLQYLKLCSHSHIHQYSINNFLCVQFCSLKTWDLERCAHDSVTSFQARSPFAWWALCTSQHTKPQLASISACSRQIHLHTMHMLVAVKCSVSEFLTSIWQYVSKCLIHPLVQNDTCQSKPSHSSCNPLQPGCIKTQPKALFLILDMKTLNVNAWRVAKSCLQRWI